MLGPYQLTDLTSQANGLRSVRSTGTLQATIVAPSLNPFHQPSRALQGPLGVLQFGNGSSFAPPDLVRIGQLDRR